MLVLIPTVLGARLDTVRMVVIDADDREHPIFVENDVGEKRPGPLSARARQDGVPVRELRIDFGLGYRVYYGIDEGRIVLLLGSGTKRGQSRDIGNAIDRWTTYKARKRKR